MKSAQFSVDYGGIYCNARIHLADGCEAGAA